MEAAGLGLQLCSVHRGQCSALPVSFSARGQRRPPEPPPSHDGGARNCALQSVLRLVVTWEPWLCPWQPKGIKLGSEFLWWVGQYAACWSFTMFKTPMSPLPVSKQGGAYSFHRRQKTVQGQREGNSLLTQTGSDQVSFIASSAPCPEQQGTQCRVYSCPFPSQGTYLHRILALPRATQASDLEVCH